MKVDICNSNQIDRYCEYSKRSHVFVVSDTQAATKQLEAFLINADQEGAKNKKVG